ncbi:hypothetical protein TSAR_006735 [Trichomalopsis sarcophagae]|uniref:Uncharacterized protein n=1 Tax=Trichomalopsis sarcophagae TaxID=543379 RepID=A0A232F0R0_9HYME|nr:hypothetical protein TSAR_006735 [Trichomalopsis sarcophagae]
MHRYSYEIEAVAKNGKADGEELEDWTRWVGLLAPPGSTSRRCCWCLRCCASRERDCGELCKQDGAGRPVT